MPVKDVPNLITLKTFKFLVRFNHEFHFYCYNPNNTIFLNLVAKTKDQRDQKKEE